MKKEITGKVFVFGKNVDTDQIYPGRFVELTDVADVIKHTLEGADPDFVKEFSTGDIVVAESNFGCGSSREHAAICLKEIGVGAVLADSFGRIFYRNGINLGLPLIVCPGIAEKVKKGEKISVDMASGEVKDANNNIISKAQPLSEYSMNILNNGGIKNMVRNKLNQA